MTDPISAGTSAAHALTAQVAAALPTWVSYFAFDGKPHCHPLSVEDLAVSDADADAALAAVRDLPDDLACDGLLRGGWRDHDIVQVLREWGWAAMRRRAGDVVIVGLSGDAAFASSFAVFAALLPFLTGQRAQWVFAAGSHGGDPAFMLELHNGQLSVHDDVQADVSYFAN